MHDTTHAPEDILAQGGTKLERRLARSKSTLYQTQVKPQRMHYFLAWFRSRKLQRGHNILAWFGSRTFRDVMKNFAIWPCEIPNTAWSTYIVFAQTLGVYQTCECSASVWGGKGGYIDFRSCAFPLFPFESHLQAPFPFQSHFQATSFLLEQTPSKPPPPKKIKTK